jgi:hypothetical protein
MGELIVMGTCSTCGKEYSRGMTICSNAFHSCRDCTWVNGERITACMGCIAAEQAYHEQWDWYLKTNILYWTDK